MKFAYWQPLHVRWLTCYSGGAFKRLLNGWHNPLSFFVFSFQTRPSSKTSQWRELKKREEIIARENDDGWSFQINLIWQMQSISKHGLFTNVKCNCLRCYFSLSGCSSILLAYTFNFSPSSSQVLYNFLHSPIRFSVTT